MEITFDDLALDLPAGTLFSEDLLTPRVKELDGKEIRLRGFIFAGGVFQSTGIKSFPFVMNTQCKFGPQGLAYGVILVDLNEGVTTDFTTYPVTVEGTLRVTPVQFGWIHLVGLSHARQAGLLAHQCLGASSVGGTVERKRAVTKFASFQPELSESKGRPHSAATKSV